MESGLELETAQLVAKQVHRVATDRYHELSREEGIAINNLVSGCESNY